MALLARDRDGLARAAEELRENGGEVMDVACDVRSQTEVQEAVTRVADRWGGVDALFNVAGVIQVGPLEHMDLMDFEQSLGVHLWGALYAVLAVVPHMRRQGSGRIVNVASIGGKIAVPHLLPYSVVGAGLDKTRYISTIRAAVRHAPTGAAGRWADSRTSRTGPTCSLTGTQALSSVLSLITRAQAAVECADFPEPPSGRRWRA